VGHYPKDTASLKSPSVYVGLIVDNGHGATETYEAYPKAATVLASSAQVTKNPDGQSGPNFSFIVSEDDRVQLRQVGSTQTAQLNFPDQKVSFSMMLTEPEPWGQRGESPEGWAGKLPFLGLHWFVYSLHSKASFKLTTPLGSITGQGFAHQEKNWGASFPSSWIWAEAVSEKGPRLTFAGGLAPLGPITVPDAYLLGYRSKKLTWSFHPQDPSLYHPRIDACAGTFEMTATSAERMLKIRIEVDPSKSGGLFKVAGPTQSGFRTDSVESYRAKVTVEAYSGLMHDHLEEKAEFGLGALEFGGGYRCPCGGERSKSASEYLTQYV